MNAKTLILIIAMLVGYQVMLAQQHKIQVRIKIIENDYKLAYPNNIDKIESHVQSQITELLQSRFPYLTFTDSRQTDSLFILVIDPMFDPDKPRPKDEVYELVFKIILQGENVRKRPDHLNILFQSTEETRDTLPGSYHSLIDKILIKFKGSLDDYNNTFVGQLFSCIPLTTDVHYIEADELWTIPISHSVSFITEDSRIFIELETPQHLKPFMDTSIVLKKVIESNQFNLYNIPIGFPDSCILAEPGKTMLQGYINSPTRKTYLLRYERSQPVGVSLGVYLGH